jgi:chondroitin synthase
MIGVVIPTFNSARTIERCLRSALAQTHADLRIVIVDGGSNDATVAKVEAFMDSRVTILRLETPSIPVQRRAGAMECGGCEWFAELDSDDWLEPHAIETMLAMVATKPCAMAYSMQRVHPASPADPAFIPAHSMIRYRPGMLIAAYITRQLQLINMSAYLNIGGHREAFELASDYDLCLRLEEVGSIDQVREVLYNHRVNPAGVSAIRSREQRIMAERAVREARARRGDRS